MIEGDENAKQSHPERVSFMSINDIAITAMQQQDVEANAGNIAYTIKVHGLKSDESEDKIEDEMICLQDGMTIKELKSYILTITKKAFYLKFHMDNDDKLQKLIDKTETWNSQRGIDNSEGVLVFDVYLDRENFDLHMEVNKEKEDEVPINPDAVEGFKYLTVKNLSG